MGAGQRTTSNACGSRQDLRSSIECPGSRAEILSFDESEVVRVDQAIAIDIRVLVLSLARLLLILPNVIKVQIVGPGSARVDRNTTNIEVSVLLRLTLFRSSARVDRNTTNIERGVLFPYNRSVAI